MRVFRTNASGSCHPAPIPVSHRGTHERWLLPRVVSESARRPNCGRSPPQLRAKRRCCSSSDRTSAPGRSRFRSARLSRLMPPLGCPTYIPASPCDEHDSRPISVHVTFHSDRRRSQRSSLVSGRDRRVRSPRGRPLHPHRLSPRRRRDAIRRPLGAQTGDSPNKSSRRSPRPSALTMLSSGQKRSRIARKRSTSRPAPTPGTRRPPRPPARNASAFS